MAITLNADSPEFEARFAAFLSTKREVSEDVDQIVRAIIARVRDEGDAALIDYTKRFDRMEISPGGLAFTQAEIDAALGKVDAGTLAALQLAHDRIAAHHRRQLPKDDRYTDAIGVELGSRWTAVARPGWCWIAPRGRTTSTPRLTACRV